ncbi:MAG: alpha/beta fold hydrolase, partial [Candidatus Odinarchaeota archaeon]
PVIFANGVFANTLSWFNQTPFFSEKGYQVILYDMRGQGNSEKPKKDYSFDIHAEDQKALLEKLGISKINHVGISYGSELGLIFALKYPETVNTLTVCSAVTYIGPYLNQVSQLWKAACVKADPMMFYYATVPFNFSETYIKENSKVLEQAKERYKLFDYPAFVRLMDSFLELNIPNEDLKKIQVPTCVIGGEKDLLKPPVPYSRVIYGNLPNSELHIIPDSGHVVTWEKPNEFNSIVLGFLEKHRD